MSINFDWETAIRRLVEFYGARVDAIKKLPHTPGEDTKFEMTVVLPHKIKLTELKFYDADERATNGTEAIEDAQTKQAMAYMTGDVPPLTPEKSRELVEEGKELRKQLHDNLKKA